MDDSSSGDSPRIYDSLSKNPVIPRKLSGVNGASVSTRSLSLGIAERMPLALPSGFDRNLGDIENMHPASANGLM